MNYRLGFITSFEFYNMDFVITSIRHKHKVSSIGETYITHIRNGSLRIVR